MWIVNSVRTFFGVVAEIGKAGVDASPRADDAVGGAGTVRHTRRPRPLHAYADVIILAAYTPTHHP